jgi:glycosyltransferase involved in cell wall biosynthesis
MWPHLPRYPGLVVLHDGQVHHERSRALLSRGREDDYRAEFRYNHPGAPEHVPDLIISALGGSLYYLYPMVRWVVRTARLVAVHSDGLAADIRSAHPGVEVRTVRHGMIDPVTEQARRASAVVRERHAIPARSVLFAAFGLVTPEKRISAGLRAFARLAPADPAPHLLLAGDTAAYYDVAAEARLLGIGDRVHITGYVPDEALAAHVLAADVCLCLRWPTSRETSGTWIRAIAAGKPTVVTDLAHIGEVPALDPRTWQPLQTVVARDVAGDSSPVSSPPVSVAVDLLDEDESLYLAMARLAGDAALRRALGQAARAYWQAHHTMACAEEDYARVIDRALQRPVPRVRDLPAHLVSDHTDLARQVTMALGVGVDILAGQREQR